MEGKKIKNKLEFFIIPIIFLLIVSTVIFFEVIRNIKEPRIKIDLKNLTNQEKRDLEEGYQVLFQIKLIKKELENLERKYKKENLSSEKIYQLKEKVNQLEEKILNEKDILEIKKKSQEFWDEGLWEEIYKLSSSAR